MRVVRLVGVVAGGDQQEARAVHQAGDCGVRAVAGQERVGVLRAPHTTVSPPTAGHVRQSYHSARPDQPVGVSRVAVQVAAPRHQLLLHVQQGEQEGGGGHGEVHARRRHLPPTPRDLDV